MRSPETRYAKTRDMSIAYQVIGQVSLDLLLVPGFLSNLDGLWEDPGFGHLVKRLATISRLNLMDPCGTGLSDRVDPARPPELDERVADLLAVLNTTGSGHAALLATSSGVASAIRFSTTHPNRTRALVLYAGFSHFAANAMDARRLEALEAAIDRGWGKGATIAHVAPDRVHDQRFVEWWSRFERLSASPAGARSLLRMATSIDVRADVSEVAVPALVLARTDDAYIRITASRNLARDLPKARLVECPGRDHPIWMGDVDRFADEIAEFLTGERPVVTSDQVLAAVLVSRIGERGRTAHPRSDPMYAERVQRFRDVMPRSVEQGGGRLVWLDDAVLLTWYPGASRAVATALRMRDLAGSFETHAGPGFADG